MGSVVVKINLDKTSFSAGVTDVRRQAKQLAGSLKEAGADGSAALIEAQKGAQKLGDGLKSAGAHGVSSMQAASGAIRLLEGGLQGNIRAAERFIGLIPGMSTALGAAFPIVGAIAFGGAMVKVGTEFTEFIRKAEDMPRVIASGFENLTLSAQAVNDELNVSNDKIENQIAKLEHKPENNLKLALDEAKVSADQFAKSVGTAATAMRELIEKNSVSMVQGFFADTAPTKALAGTIKPFEDDKEHFSTQAAIGKSLGDDNRYNTNMKSFRDKEDAELEKMKKILADAQAKQAEMFGVNKVNQDQTPIMTMAQGVIDQIQLSRAHEASLGTKSKDDARLAADQKAAQMAADAKKAQEALLKQDEDAERQQNLFNKMTVNETLQFWSDRLAAFQKGSEQYLQVRAKIYEAIEKRPDLTKTNRTNQAKVGKSDVEGGDVMAAAQRSLAQLTIQDLERQNKAAEKYNQIATAGAEIAARNKAILDTANVSIGVEEGTMSKLAAAQEMARIHTQEHADALAAVNRELETQLNLIRNDPNPNLSDEDRNRASQNAQDSAGNQRSAINGTYGVQQVQDKAAIQSQTISGAAKDSLADMVQNFNDLAAQLKQIIPQTLEGLNTQIVAAMTGKHTDFGKVFSQTGDSLMKASLQKLEGGLLGAAGVGKPDGSKNNPIYTMDAGSAIGGFNSNPLFRPFSGGQQDPNGQQDGQGQSGGGFWGSLGKMGGSFLKSFFKGGGSSGGGDDSAGDGSDGNGLDWDFGFQGGFARGGDVLPHHSFLVGERGPELLMSRHAATVIPNHRIGGGDTHHHWNIDARGSTDPAAVHAAVMRAAPHIVASAVQAQNQQAKRAPRGR